MKFTNTSPHFCLMLISREYVQSEWAVHERRDALSRAIQRKEGNTSYPSGLTTLQYFGCRPRLYTFDMRATGRKA
jgi:hypothetical protein